MRFSEKLEKENKEKEQRNLKGRAEVEKERGKTSEVNEREELIEELEKMVGALKTGVTGLRDTLKKDEKVVSSLDEQTYSSLDKVSALNSRMKKYVESTSGMTCSMCLMMATVVFTSICAFVAIYFV